MAWASCWPAALQAAREHNPTLILLGASFAILPDTLDSWISQPLHTPDIHIVVAPEAPDPHLLAGALARVIFQVHSTGAPLEVICYPIPVGPDQWTPYTLHFDSVCRQIAVMIDETPPLNASAGVPFGFTTDHTARLSIHDRPLSLRVTPAKGGRITLMVMPSEQQWSHSLVTGLALGLFVTWIWGLSAGLIAVGAYALHLFSHQWGFTGSALFWPFKPARCPGLQWVKPRQDGKIDLAILWLAFLLLVGNVIQATAPTLASPSRFQLLLFGGAIPLALSSFFRLNKRPEQRSKDRSKNERPDKN